MGDYDLRKLALIVLAGLSGSIVGQYKTEPMPPSKRAFSVFCGLVTAIFLGPPAALYLGVVDYQGVAAIAFVIGAFWMKVIEGVSETVSSFQFTRRRNGE